MSKTVAPKTSILGWLSAEGRLKNRWARALKETDAKRSLEGLRQVQKQLAETPAEFASLLMPFLDDLFEAGRVKLLTEADLKAIFDTGSALAKLPKPPTDPVKIWFRVIKACDDRGEKLKANALLRHIYKSPIARADIKAHCCQELARRNARSDEDLLIYSEHLQRLSDYSKAPEILSILSSILKVDFDSGEVLIKRAGETARRLEESKIKIPGLKTILGLSALLIEKNPAKAVQFFTTAFNEDSSAKLALLGLAAAWIQNGNYDRIFNIPEGIYKDAEPVIKNLMALGKTLNWLDNPAVTGAAPVQSGALENSGLQKYVGDIIDAALGRLYLLEGNAVKAAAMMLPYADKHSQQPRWRYYAAWAAILTDNRQALLRQFESKKTWKGSWATACLLLDFDPLLGKNQNVHFQVASTAYSSITVARLALAGSTVPSAIAWKPAADNMEEELEALRTVLGYGFFKREVQVIKNAASSPLFLRLPLAEQTLWNGLFALLKGDGVQGKAMLEKAAVTYGHRRANLILAVHCLEQKQIAKARHYLEQSGPNRVDAKIELLRAYLEACEGKTNAATERLEKFATADEPRALYALGNIYLQRAEEGRAAGKNERVQFYLQQAAGAFKNALNNRKARMPADVDLLMRGADFVAFPEQHAEALAGMYTDFTKQNSLRKNSWMAWNVALARLWAGTSAEAAPAGEEMLTLLEEAEKVDESALVVLAQATARACSNVQHAHEINALLKLLNHLSAKTDHPVVKHFNRLGTAAANRFFYLNAAARTQKQVRQNLIHLGNMDPANTAIILLNVHAALEAKDNAAAIIAIQQAQPENDAERQLCQALESLLAGKTPAEISAEPGAGASDELVQAHRLLQAAVLFANKKEEKGYEALLAAMNVSTEAAAKIINVEKFLPALCALSTKKAVPSSLVEELRKLVAANIDGRQSFTVARCAAAIGEAELACRLWEKLLEKNGAPDYRREYAGFLCHLSVIGYKSDHIAAAKKLRKAAEYSA